MKKESKILYFLQEITIVVIGVLIAVSIGNYKEHNDNKEYIKKTLLAIDSEIKLSQAELDTVLNRHIELYEILENEIDKNEQTIGKIVSSSGGFQVATIKNVSLRFFVNNKAELLDFKVISQLLDIEQKANILTEKINMLTEFSYENVNKTDKETKIKFTYLLINVIDGEQTLLESYSHFLEENNRLFEKQN